MPLTVKLEGREFTLSNKCLTAMKETLDATREKERGFMFCQDGEVTPGRSVIGGRGSITVRNCTKVEDEVLSKRPAVGFYHTHPTPGTSSASWHDALSIISKSVRTGIPWLGCRGAKSDAMIQCDTVKEIPERETYEALRARQRRMRFTNAKSDPTIWQHFGESFAFASRDIPEMIRPTRIREEQFEFEGRRFIRYLDLETRRQWTLEAA